MTRRTETRTPCGCGCGRAVARRYAPGHDARHKATLCGQVATGGVAASRAADLLADLGWAGWADVAALRATPYRTSRGRPIAHVLDVDTWQVDHLGGCHAYRGCTRLTRAARMVSGTNRITRLASDRYVTLVTAGWHTPRLMVGSWDQCPECTVTQTRDEDAERVTCYKAATWEGDPRTPTKIPLTWTVARDTLDEEPILLLTGYCNPVTGRITRTWADQGWAAPTNEQAA